MVSFSWWNYSCSLSKYVSKLISNLLIIAYGVDLCPTTSVSVLSFSDFIPYILLKSYAPFNNF